ncbi:hypothetical protein SH661x_004315 [Planctomicrobium sp. SH661]|uniref:hypothetical protein n=1 Tax=Planctomicrobium sp. SH661 TaxID=3448124 RepID=UPI003F5C6EB0
MTGEKSQYHKYLKKGTQAVDNYLKWVNFSPADKAAKFAKLLKAVGILMALLGAAGAAADTCQAFTPATSLGDEEIQRLYREALKALMDERFEDARRVLFGKEEMCAIEETDPDGVICKLLSRLVHANELLYNRAIEMDAALRAMFSELNSSTSFPERRFRLV